MSVVRISQVTIGFSLLFGLIADWAGVYVTIRGDRHFEPVIDFGVLSTLGWLALRRKTDGSGWFGRGLALSFLGGIIWFVVRSIAMIHVPLTSMSLLMAGIWSISAALAWCVAATSMHAVLKRRTA
jgi:hypothetical protein